MNKLKELKEYIQKEIPEINNCPICGSKKGVFKCSRGARNCADCMQYVGEIKISLEDVLRVIEIKTRPYEWVVSTNGMFSKMIKHCGNPEYVGTGVAWKLGLPLDQQSEKTIEFLHELLIKNK